MITIKNNSILHNYKKIFKNNIHSYSDINNKIRIKINIANRSIMNELVILYNIKNITKEHPYKYLAILQNDKYYIPYISLNKDHKKYNYLNSIKTNTSKIIQKVTNINSISYRLKRPLLVK